MSLGDLCAHLVFGWKSLSNWRRSNRFPELTAFIGWETKSSQDLKNPQESTSKHVQFFMSTRCNCCITLCFAPPWRWFHMKNPVPWKSMTRGWSWLDPMAGSRIPDPKKGQSLVRTSWENFNLSTWLKPAYSLEIEQLAPKRERQNPEAGGRFCEASYWLMVQKSRQPPFGWC